MSDAAEIEKQEDFPSVELAYPFAVASYELAQKRFDGIDTKIQSILSFAATLTLAAPVVASSRAITFHSPWFYAAFGAFLGAVVIGMYGRLKGKLLVIHPQNLWDEWLPLKEWEFKKSLIYYAGKHYGINQSLINHKGNLANLTAILFFAEVAFLVGWVVDRT